MKKYKNISTLIIAMTMSFSTALHANSDKDPVTTQDVTQETKELVNTLEKYTYKQRDEALRNAEKAMQNIDRRIDIMETRINKNWDDMSQVARQKTQENLETLREERNELTDQYQRFKNSSVDAWESTKKGFSKAYQAVSDSWEKVKSEYGISD